MQEAKKGPATDAVRLTTRVFPSSRHHSLPSNAPMPGAHRAGPHLPLCRAARKRAAAVFIEKKHTTVFSRSTAKTIRFFPEREKNLPKLV